MANGTQIMQIMQTSNNVINAVDSLSMDEVILTEHVKLQR